MVPLYRPDGSWLLNGSFLQRASGCHQFLRYLPWYVRGALAHFLEVWGPFIIRAAAFLWRAKCFLLIGMSGNRLRSCGLPGLLYVPLDSNQKNRINMHTLVESNPISYNCKSKAPWYWSRCLTYHEIFWYFSYLFFNIIPQFLPTCPL